MLKYLKDNGCIQVERLLILKGKELGLVDQEIYILLLIYVLKDVHVKMISPSLLVQYSSLSHKELDHVLSSLLKKKFIFNRNGTIQLNRLVERLLESKQEEVPEVNLLDEFEKQFARALSPMEMDILKEWKEQGYSDERILLALKEAVKSQILNFRYIEGILNNWAKKGVKQRYVEQEPEPRKVAVSHYKWWEDE